MRRQSTFLVLLLLALAAMAAPTASTGSDLLSEVRSGPLPEASCPRNLRLASCIAATPLANCTDDAKVDGPLLCQNLSACLDEWSEGDECRDATEECVGTTVAEVLNCTQEMVYFDSFVCAGLPFSPSAAPCDPVDAFSSVGWKRMAGCASPCCISAYCYGLLLLSGDALGPGCGGPPSFSRDW